MMNASTQYLALGLKHRKMKVFYLNAGDVVVGSELGASVVAAAALQLAASSTKNLSQPLMSQSCLCRSMPSEQRSTVGHHKHCQSKSDPSSDPCWD